MPLKGAAAASVRGTGPQMLGVASQVARLDGCVRPAGNVTINRSGSGLALSRNLQADSMWCGYGVGKSRTPAFAHPSCNLRASPARCLASSRPQSRSTLLPAKFSKFSPVLAGNVLLDGLGVLVSLAIYYNACNPAATSSSISTLALVATIFLAVALALVPAVALLAVLSVTLHRNIVRVAIALVPFVDISSLPSFPGSPHHVYGFCLSLSVKGTYCPRRWRGR
ncbi:hypothetical protein C8F04DRAFT_1248367 [Mycena alexandri]|uniref:Uncharacterized protein n=1 Tax=Mycena alexandri TaxID=1745969 RepID=A0AAD6XF95_9AGAR|nr:hypothetical protein C8F04DRAFT_1248367 [Mycena alexandri]